MSNKSIYYSFPSHPTSTVCSGVLTENPFKKNKNETRVKAGKVGCYTVHLKTCQTNRLSTQQFSRGNMISPNADGTMEDIYSKMLRTALIVNKT